MNFLTRAWKNVSRRLSKSILLCLTFFVIGNFVILGLGVSSAAENAKVLTRKQMRAIVTYEVDYNAYYNYVDSLTDQDEVDEAYNNWPVLDINAANEIATDSRVIAFNNLSTSIAYSAGFDNVPVGNEETSQNSFTYTDENGNEVVQKVNNISIYGNRVPNMIELAEGTFTVTSGEFYSQSNIDNSDNVCLITQELADQNNFKVGDTLSLQLTDDNTIDQITKDSDKYSKDYFVRDFEIIGIYNTKNDVDPNGENFKWMQPYESPKNIILMPATTLSQFMYDNNTAQFEFNKAMYPDMYSSEPQTLEQIAAPTKAIYLLDDPLNVDQFVIDNESKATDYTMLNANNETFQKLAKPLDSMSFFANLIVGIVVVNAVIIISLVTALTLKTREFEIGVLLSLGVSKFKVVLQLFCEVLIVAILGFSLAVISGSLAAGYVGEQVLAFQQSQDDTDTNTGDDGYYWSGDNTNYFSDITQEDLYSQYHVSISPLIVLEIYSMGVIVVFISIVIPSIMIMRLNPKQILLSTN